MELVNTMIQKMINIASLQETNWVGKKSKEIEDTRYRLWFVGKENHRSGVGMIVDKQLKENVIDSKRLNDRIIGIKLLLGKERPNIINAYVP